jgi:trans-aconitate methyltransferase
MIQSITIDSTNCKTDLCLLAVKYPTDKCPYNENPKLHKHPYTPIYSLLFSKFRYDKIRFLELGILENNSMKCWREFFPNAKLFGFDNSIELINIAKKDNLIDTKYDYLDVSDSFVIHSVLEKNGSNFDVILDDSSHEFDHQINIIKSSIPHLKTGGYLIIEDIFKKEDENRYCEAIKDYSKYFSSITFINAEHELRNSFGWDNDKLLILQRNDFKFEA